MNKIYTKKGDNKETSLAGGKSILKSDIRIDSYGTIDELIAFIGLLRNYINNNPIEEFLITIQNNLMAIASILSSDYPESKCKISKFNANEIINLENEIDKIETLLTPLNKFIIPGKNKTSSFCHISRTICRRAERIIVKLSLIEKVDKNILIYVNRLSDYFFVLSRLLDNE